MLKLSLSCCGLWTKSEGFIAAYLTLTEELEVFYDLCLVILVFHTAFLLMVYSHFLSCWVKEINFVIEIKTFGLTVSIFMAQCEE